MNIKKILVIGLVSLILLVAVGGVLYTQTIPAEENGNDRVSLEPDPVIDSNDSDQYSEDEDLNNSDYQGSQTPLTDVEEEESDQGGDLEGLVACLDQAGLVIYGSFTCPVCTRLADSFGGYEALDPIYVECSDEPNRCHQEMQTRYVPEIQIEGELYQGSREPADLAEAAGCEW